METLFPEVVQAMLGQLNVPSCAFVPFTDRLPISRRIKVTMIMDRCDAAAEGIFRSPGTDLRIPVKNF